VVDWLWVARARALGAKLLFYPYSSSVGSIMVKSDSPVRKIDDFKGPVLAVAGGPLDKSWLIVQAAATKVTTLFVTHDLAEAIQLADRLFFLSDRSARIIVEKSLPPPRGTRSRDVIASICDEMRV